jgi:ABC-type transport system involved in multi-copper enzyme maturation permease subunit
MFDNPLALRELRAYRRRWQHGPVVYAACAIAVAGVLWANLSALSMLLGSTNRADWQALHLGALSLQIFLTWLAGCTAATNAVTLEREQQTWEMLLSTRLRPMEIVLGKLLPRLLWILFVDTALVPIQIICATWGGTGLIFLLASQTVVHIWGIFATMAGLFISFLCKKTATATAVTMLALISVTIGPFLAAAALMPYGDPWNAPFAYLNPIRWAGGLASRSHRAEDTAAVLVGVLLCLGGAAAMAYHIARRLDEGWESDR